MKYFVTAIISLFWVWVIASYVEVLCHNWNMCEYTAINFFKIFFN